MTVTKGNYNDYISENLKFLRTLANLSQEQLAIKIGLNRGNITSYERGIAKPSIESLQRVSKYFNVALVDLIQNDLSLQVDKGQVDNSLGASLDPKKVLSAPTNRALSIEQDQERNKIIDNLLVAQKYRIEQGYNLQTNMKQILGALDNLSNTIQDLSKMNQEILNQIKKNK